MDTCADIAEEVLTSIRQIVRRISEHSNYLTREIGLTVPQLMCLKAIGELEERESEITVNMVGNRVQLAPATASRIIDRLARSGLVTRERRSKDRRRVCLSLTHEGLERYQTLPMPLQEKFLQRLGSLPDEERQALLDAQSSQSGPSELESASRGSGICETATRGGRQTSGRPAPAAE